MHGLAELDCLAGDDVLERAALAAGYFFFFNDTATTEIYTLSLHDALPSRQSRVCHRRQGEESGWQARSAPGEWLSRSEEHTSELQSRGHLVCRLLLEK